MPTGLLKKQAGFTLIEVMSVMVILTMVVGVVGQVFITGLRLTKVQSNELDLRAESRQIMTQMEKDIQASALVKVKDITDSVTGIQYKSVQLFNNTMLEKAYQYDTASKEIKLVYYDSYGNLDSSKTKTIATNVTSVYFGEEANQTKTVTSVPLKIVLAQEKETLDSTTNASPRWNAGINVPAIISVTPNNLAINKDWFDPTKFVPPYIIPTTDSPKDHGTPIYTTVKVIGQFTSWDNDSVVTLRDGNTIYASSAWAPSGYSNGFSLVSTPASAGNPPQQTLQTRLYTQDGSVMSYGFYDLFVTTPNVVDVWSPSVFTFRWDSSSWAPAVGGSGSSGWTANYFPYIIKQNTSTNDKPEYFVAKASAYPDVEVGLSMDNSILKTSSYGNSTSFDSVPDAEVAVWATNNTGAKDNKYVGFGINSKYIILRTVTNTNDKNGNTSETFVLKGKVPLADIGMSGFTGSVILGVKSDTNGVLTLYVNNKEVPSTAISQAARTFTPNPNGYLGVVVPNQAMSGTTFSIIRL